MHLEPVCGGFGLEAKETETMRTTEEGGEEEAVAAGLRLASQFVNFPKQAEIQGRPGMQD